MLDQVLTSIPAAPTASVALGATAGALAGGILWLAGSRVSRSFITLVCVTTGAFIGLKLPELLNLPVRPWATATAGALGLGLLGYGLHRGIVRFGLVALLVSWAVIGSFAAYNVPVHFPAWPEDLSPIDYGQQLWGTFPPGLQRLLPAALLLAVAGGSTIALMWQRLATYLFHALLGASLLLVLGTLAMRIGRPTLLAVIPASTSHQAMLLGCLSLFGAIVQWRTGSAPNPNNQDQP